jgi:hypothetical protein
MSMRPPRVPYRVTSTWAMAGLTAGRREAWMAHKAGDLEDGVGGNRKVGEQGAAAAGN